jgi:hypothetical protein
MEFIIKGGPHTITALLNTFPMVGGGLCILAAIAFNITGHKKAARVNFIMGMLGILAPRAGSQCNL